MSWILLDGPSSLLRTNVYGLLYKIFHFIFTTSLISLFLLYLRKTVDRTLRETGSQTLNDPSNKWRKDHAPSHSSEQRFYTVTRSHALSWSYAIYPWVLESIKAFLQKLGFVFCLWSNTGYVLFSSVSKYILKRKGPMIPWPLSWLISTWLHW